MLVATGNPTAYTPNYANPPNRKADLLAVQIPLMSIALLFVALRLISRCLAVRGLGWDDLVLIVSTVGKIDSSLLNSP